jgi:hypothetical protein
MVVSKVMAKSDKLPAEAQDKSSVFVLGIVVGASVPLLFLALGA